MHNIWLIVKREYLERVRTKAFVIFTLMFPLLMAATSVLPSLLAMKKSGGRRHLLIAADNAKFGAEAQKQLSAGGKNLGFDYQVDLLPAPTEEQRAHLNQQVDSKEIDGYIWATDAAIASRKVVYSARQTNDFVEIEVLRNGLRDALLRQTLRNRGMTDVEVTELLKPLEMDAVQIDKGKTKKSSEVATLLTTIMLVVMLYVTVLMYGIMVMRSVLEEKTSRVMEVMLSAVTAKELMAGKIVGVGAVGITQILIWATMGALVLGPGIALMPHGTPLEIGLSPTAGIFFAIFFLLGYLLYSAMCAALGAMVNSEQEAQQMQFIVILPLVVSITMMMFVIRQPNAPVAVWMSLVPFCTPVLMFVRILANAAPAWQIALSIFIMLITTYGLLLLCSRIYRVGILMYGKRPTLPEIVKWLKYS